MVVVQVVTRAADRVPRPRLIIRRGRGRRSAHREIGIDVIAVVIAPPIAQGMEDRRRMLKPRLGSDVQRAIQIPLPRPVVTEFAGCQRFCTMIPFAEFSKTKSTPVT